MISCEIIENATHAVTHRTLVDPASSHMLVSKVKSGIFVPGAPSAAPVLHHVHRRQLHVGYQIWQTSLDRSTRTRWDVCVAMIGRADIEGSKCNVTMNG